MSKRYLDRFDSTGRKKVPMYSGVMAYFPDAIAALAEHSFKGNEKHNPGEPLHHARAKSMDHTDCIMRHLANHKGMDGDCEEAVALLWRAAALCQEVLERKYALTLPEGVIDPRAFSETNSLVGPNGEQAPADLSPPHAAAPVDLITNDYAPTGIALDDDDPTGAPEEPDFVGVGRAADQFGGFTPGLRRNMAPSDRTEAHDFKRGPSYSSDRDPTA